MDGGDDAKEKKKDEEAEEEVMQPLVSIEPRLGGMNSMIYGSSRFDSEKQRNVYVAPVRHIVPGTAKPILLNAPAKRHLFEQSVARLYSAELSSESEEFTPFSRPLKRARGDRGSLSRGRGAKSAGNDAMNVAFEKVRGAMEELTHAITLTDYALGTQTHEPCFDTHNIPSHQKNSATYNGIKATLGLHKREQQLREAAERLNACADSLSEANSKNTKLFRNVAHLREMWRLMPHRLPSSVPVASDDNGESVRGDQLTYLADCSYASVGSTWAPKDGRSRSEVCVARIHRTSTSEKELCVDPPKSCKLVTLEVTIRIGSVEQSKSSLYKALAVEHGSKADRVLSAIRHSTLCREIFDVVSMEANRGNFLSRVGHAKSDSSVDVVLSDMDTVVVAFGRGRVNKQMSIRLSPMTAEGERHGSDAPVCDCPCGSKLVTIKAEYGGSQECLYPKALTESAYNSSGGRSASHCHKPALPFGERCPSSGGVGDRFNYQQAEDYCAAAGLRMCHLSEVLGNAISSNPSCGLDDKYVWTKTPCDHCSKSGQDEWYYVAYPRAMRNGRGEPTCAKASGTETSGVGLSSGIYVACCADSGNRASRWELAADDFADLGTTAVLARINLPAFPTVELVMLGSAICICSAAVMFISGRFSERTDLEWQRTLITVLVMIVLIFSLLYYAVVFCAEICAERVECLCAPCIRCFSSRFKLGLHDVNAEEEAADDIEMQTFHNPMQSKEQLSAISKIEELQSQLEAAQKNVTEQDKLIKDIRSLQKNRPVDTQNQAALSRKLYKARTRARRKQKKKQNFQQTALHESHK
eukprot:g2633.t1